MACCGAAITPESSAIDAQIKTDEKVQKVSLKILVLGTSASGKSTVAKQMKILHCQGFSAEELHNYKQILILNIFNGMKELVFQAEQFGIKILRKNKKVASYFSNANPYTETLNNETVEQAKQLWADKGTFPFLIFPSTSSHALPPPPPPHKLKISPSLQSQSRRLFPPLLSPSSLLSSSSFPLSLPSPSLSSPYSPFSLLTLPL